MLLQKFGGKIILLTVDFTEALDYCCQYLENYISEYCAISLMHLKLIHLSETSNITQHVYTNLQTLEFQWCSISGPITNFNFYFPNLRRLIFLKWNTIDQNNLKIQYSSLQELITTVYLLSNMRHFNITMNTLVTIRNLNPDLNTSIITADNM